jgi:hypothetical protein
MWGGAAVFLDYDGTLTPIADRPGDAVISVRRPYAGQAVTDGPLLRRSAAATAGDEQSQHRDPAC